MTPGKALPVPHSEEGRNLTLYELTGEYALLSEAMNEMSEEDSDRMAEVLNSIAGAIENKVEYMGMVMKQKQVEAEWISSQAAIYEEEVKRLKNRAKTRLNNADRLKRYIEDQISQLGDDTQKFEGNTLSLTLPKGGRTVLEIENEDKIPEQYKRATIQIKLSDLNKLEIHRIEFTLKGVDIQKSELDKVYAETNVVPPGMKSVPARRVLKIY